VPLDLFGCEAGCFSSLSLSCSKSLGDAAGHLSLVEPNLTRPNDDSPRSLPRQDQWVVRCLARSKPAHDRPPRLRSCLNSINELAGSELTHRDVVLVVRN
jgi:hypothetical protein